MSMSKSDPIVYGLGITSNTGSVVTGVFKFDGRLKAGQGADFTYVTDPAYVNPQKPAWHVIVNRCRNGTTSVIRRSMKECVQKDLITYQLQVQLDDMLADSAAHTVTPSTDAEFASADGFVEEFGVETERDLSATVQKVISDTRMSNRDLAAQNVSTQQATTDDLLEIPDFLKRT